MKQLFAILFLLMPCCIPAQDLIIKKDRSTIRCRVEEVTDSTVSYTPWDDESETTYLIDKSLVSTINYENGTKIAFGKPVRRQKEQKKEPRQTTYYRHEVNVGWGGMFVRKRQWRGYYDLIASDFRIGNMGYDLFSFRASGGLHFGYYYHLNKRLAVGMLAAFTRFSKSYYYYEKEVLVPVGNENVWNEATQRYVQEPIYKNQIEEVNELCGTAKYRSVFILPTAKWSWMNCNWCSLYVKGGIGIHVMRQTFDSDLFPDSETARYNKNKVYLAYLLTPIGWEIGRQNIRWFAEVGFGSNTNFQVGMTYRFGRY